MSARRHGVAALLALLVSGGLTAGPARAEGPGGRTPRAVPVLVDAGGAEIGELLGVTALPVLLPTVLVRGEEAAGPAVLGADRFLIGTAVIGFAGPDCLGVPLLVPLGPGADGLLYPLTGTVTGAELFVQDGPITLRTVGSVVAVAPVPPPTCTPVMPASPLPAAPARVLLELAPFTPPFELALASRPVSAAARDPGVPGPRLVADATGRLVGPLVSLPFDGTFRGGQVAVPADGGPAFLRVARDGVQGGLRPALYEADDCTGPVLIQAPAPGEAVFAPSALGRDGVLYLAGGPVASAVIASRWDTEVTPPVCDTPAPAATDVQSGTPVLDTAILTPPFAAD